MEFMVVCFDGLDTFGKTPDQLKNAIKLFLMTLADYPAILIRRAFEKWVRTETKMPAPADIIGLMHDDNTRLLDFLNHVRTGGMLADFAEQFVAEKLGDDWRKYV